MKVETYSKPLLGFNSRVVRRGDIGVFYSKILKVFPLKYVQTDKVLRNFNLPCRNSLRKVFNWPRDGLRE